MPVCPCKVRVRRGTWSSRNTLTRRCSSEAATPRSRSTNPRRRVHAHLFINLSYLPLFISLLSMLYTYVVPWSEFPIEPTYPTIITQNLHIRAPRENRQSKLHFIKIAQVLNDIDQSWIRKFLLICERGLQTLCCVSNKKRNPGRADFPYDALGGLGPGWARLKSSARITLLLGPTLGALLF